MITEYKELQNLTPLLEALARKRFGGYVHKTSEGGLVITIPGIASFYDKISRSPVEED